MKREVNIGLDIGVASCGWAILDSNTFEIIRHGVRMFPSMETGKESKLENLNRREKRSLRRQIRRRRQRKLDFINFLIKEKIVPKLNHENLIEEFSSKYLKNKDILNLRYHGLTNELKINDLIPVMYWYLANRGYKYEIADEKQTKEIDKIFNLYKEDFQKDTYPVNIQRKFFEKNNNYRGDLGRLFSFNQFLKEIEKILSNVQKNTKLKEKFLYLFKQRRSYEEGPGSKDAYMRIKDPKILKAISDSKFNRFTFENGKLKASDNMWNNTIGKCVYDGENRAPKNCFTAELFNLLNDLNNLTLSTGEKLSKEDKIQIIKMSLNKQKTLNTIVNYLKKNYEGIESIENIEGFRIDKNDKEIITELTGWHNIKSILRKFNISLLDSDILGNNKLKFDYYSWVDDVILSMSKFKSCDKRIEELNKNDFIKNKLNSEEINKLAEKLPSFSTNHSFSINFMKNTMIPQLLNEHYNQMSIIEANNIKPIAYFKNNNTKYFPTKWIDSQDFIASPTIKRGIRQTFKVLNTLVKKHNSDWIVKNIVIEMARELNSKMEKNRQKGIQQFLENRNKRLQSKIDSIEENLNIKIRGVALRKLDFFEEQNGRDAYTGEELNVDKVILDNKYSEIDHIIPYSQCYDNSRTNKVLVLSQTNAKKGQQTPYKFLKMNDFIKMAENFWEKWYSSTGTDNKLKQYKKRKLANLKTKKDFSKPDDEVMDFIGRNLVDTRYITKEVLHNLQKFIISLNENNDKNSMFYKTKIKTVNGRMTSFIRNKIEKAVTLKRPEGLSDGSFDEKTKKKRRIWNGHHAEDAVIVIYSALKNYKANKIIEKILSNNYDEKNKNNKIQLWGLDEKMDYKQIGDALNNSMDHVSFSHMLIKKETIDFSKEKLYGSKYIYDEKKKKSVLHKVKRIPVKKLTKEYFKDDYMYNIPMKKYDPKTWNSLKSWFESTEGKEEYVDLRKKAKIKSIKIIMEQKSEDKIMWFHHNGNLVKSFKETLNWFKILIFKTNKDKNFILPITVLNKKYFNENFNKYDNYILDLLKSNDVNLNIFPFKLDRGTIIQEDINNNLYKIVGCGDSKLEIKPLSYISSKRMYKSINRQLKNWKIIEINSLGDVITTKWVF